MKDIDGQEIQVGDVVLDLWNNSPIPCRVTAFYHAVGTVQVTHKNGRNNIWPNQIFCLFYRKPTVVEPIINPIVYIDDGNMFLRKIENGITYAINRTEPGEWFQDSSAHTLDYLLNDTSYKQISEAEAKALRPDAFK